jgi:creatinine amidohydrolase
MNKLWLQDFRSSEVEQELRKGNDIILIPVGSLEQHGRHLPLGTDSFMAIRLAEDAARRSQVMLTPPLWFGWSEHHMGYSGTITLKAETLIKVVEDVCLSLITHGFKKLLIINGHRITNLSPLVIAAMNIREKTKAFLTVIDPAVIGATIGKELRRSAIGGLGHGGELETAHLLYLYPDLVEMKDAVKIIPKYPSEFMELDFYAGGDRVSWTFAMEELSEGSGGFGDPTCASKEQGAQYHNRVVENICKFIDAVRTIKVKVKKP